MFYLIEGKIFHHDTTSNKILILSSNNVKDIALSPFNKCLASVEDNGVVVRKWSSEGIPEEKK